MRIAMGSPDRNLCRRRAPHHGNRRLRGAVLGMLAALALPLTEARAADPDFFVSLGYDVDPSASGCPEARVFSASVARQLGYEPFRDGSPLRVAVRVAQTSRGIEGVVDWRDADGTWRGERRFVARDGNCTQLLVEMSFSVGIQMQILRAGNRALSSPGDIAPALVAIQQELSAPSADVTRPPAASADVGARSSGAMPSPSAWLMWVGGGPSLRWAMAPSVTADLRVFFGARRRALSLELGAIASLPSTARQPDGSGFRQSIVASSGAVCGHMTAVAACLLGQVGRIQVEGSGVDEPHSRAGLLVQAGLRLSADLRLGRSWLALTHVDGLGLLTPWRVDLNGLEVWRMPRVGVLAGVDLAVRFP